MILFVLILTDLFAEFILLAQVAPPKATTDDILSMFNSGGNMPVNMLAQMGGFGHPQQVGGLLSLSQLNPNSTPDLSQLNPNSTLDLSQLNPKKFRRETSV
jgi:hypothetical protein